MKQSFSPRTVGSQDLIGFLTLETLVLGKKPVTESGTGPRAPDHQRINHPPSLAAVARAAPPNCHREGELKPMNLLTPLLAYRY
jgi:hypothetical protein